MEKIATEITIPVKSTQCSDFLPTPLWLLNDNENVVNLHQKSSPVGDLRSQEPPRGTRRGSRDNLLKMFMEKHQPYLHGSSLKDGKQKQHQIQLYEKFRIMKYRENVYSM